MRVSDEALLQTYKIPTAHSIKHSSRVRWLKITLWRQAFCVLGSSFSWLFSGVLKCVMIDAHLHSEILEQLFGDATEHAICGPGPFLDETGRMDEALEPLLFLTFLDRPEGHEMSPVDCLASLLKKRLPGCKREWDSGPLVTGTSLVWDCALLLHHRCVLPSIFRKQLRNACEGKRQSRIPTALLRSPQRNAKA